MHLHLHITPNNPDQAILDELLASVELRETLAEGLEEHMAVVLLPACRTASPGSQSGPTFGGGKLCTIPIPGFTGFPLFFAARRFLIR